MKLPLTPSPFALLTIATGIACWPVLDWFIKGSMDASNDSASLLAAATAALLVWRSPATTPVRWPLALPALLLAAYGVATAMGVPPAIGAVPAAAALAALASAYRRACRLDVALLALSMLALPLAASLQFYLGYPMRVVAGTVSVALLRMGGVGVVRDGATLVWGTQLISIDAPCSGVKMLWAGLYLVCALAAGQRLNMSRAIVALAWSCIVIVAANAMRACALFYTESGLIPLPAAAHEGIGVVCFVAAALTIFGGVRLIARGAP
ncbi:archaeosortase/exosortase family protein [Massilia sp. CF038]|uniref:archaeosortase/exosortase family protein n=1 Tax=Massilia sp. CF038 TaxID=1881045 RepID=UPI000923AA71|nr:archaeosortase/exosortase family protein [Massilia sp. CF038]SHG55030.1 exosortase/archaeosortase family protein [Massilia sp. CF038]